MTDLIAETRDRILTARYHLRKGVSMIARYPAGNEHVVDARTWIDAAERLADELETATAKLQAVRKLMTPYEGAGHNPGCTGEAECAACWVRDIRNALKPTAAEGVSLVAPRRSGQT